VIEPDVPASSVRLLLPLEEAVATTSAWPGEAAAGGREVALTLRRASWILADLKTLGMSIC